MTGPRLLTQFITEMVSDLFAGRNCVYSRWRRTGLWLSFLVSCIGPALAEFHVDTWTTESGLPQNIVIDICQTPDGYLWLATLDGLVRFDGVRFVVFNRSNTAGILGNRFTSIYCPSNGEIWAATESTGVTRYSHRVFQTYAESQGLPANQRVALTGDDEGHIWALFQSKIAQWDPATSSFSPIASDRGNYEYTSGRNGGFWTVRGASLQLFSKGEFSRYPLPSEASWRAPRMVGRDVNGTLWIADARGRLARYDQGSWLSPILPSAPNRESRTLTHRDVHGSAWRIIVDYKQGGPLVQSLVLKSRGKLISLSFNALLKDREGSLWLATDGQGLCRIRRQTINVLSKRDGLPDGDIYPIFQDHAGDVWIGTWNGGLARYHDGKVTTFSLSQGLHSNRITSIGEDRDGGLWISSSNGVYHRENGNFKFKLVSREIQPGIGAAMAIYRDTSGVLWFGTTGGLIRYEDGRWTSIRTTDGLASDDVRVVVSGRAGNLWIGGYGGLTSFKSGRFQRWTESDGLPSNSIRSLYEDARGVLWIGTYDGGLGRLEQGHLTRYTVRDGLFNSGVFQILEDDSGYLWMSCNRGIFRVAKSELDRFATGQQKTLSSTSYTKADGMQNTECNGGLSPAGIRTRDGKLWFPTQDGVAIIDPATVQPNLRAPPIVIESVSVDREIKPWGSTIKILPGQDNVEIAYTAPSLVDSEQIQFKYALAGLDRGWINAGTRRVAYYSHLPPGEYDFHVIAANSDGIWNLRGETAHLSILPRFYQTAWFMLILAILGASIIVIAWRLRTLQFERASARQQAIANQLIASQESERKRIAAELHDSLGQHLLIIKNWAMVALHRSAASETLEPLTEISSTAALAIREVREISYNLRPFQLERLGLTTAIKDLVQQMAGSSSIQFIARISPLDGAFAPDAEMGVYRICQESLNNIVRHSEATEAAVSVHWEQDAVEIVITDNGCGFTPAQGYSTPPRQGGFGLLSIAQRVRMLSGHFSVLSSPGDGTVISIVLQSHRRKHE